MCVHVRVFHVNVTDSVIHETCPTVVQIRCLPDFVDVIINTEYSHFLSVCLSPNLSVCLSVYLCVYLYPSRLSTSFSVCLPITVMYLLIMSICLCRSSVSPSFCLSIHIRLCICISNSVCLSSFVCLCLSIYYLSLCLIAVIGSLSR